MGRCRNTNDFHSLHFLGGMKWDRIGSGIMCSSLMFQKAASSWCCFSSAAKGNSLLLPSLSGARRDPPRLTPPVYALRLGFTSLSPSAEEDMAEQEDQYVPMGWGEAKGACPITTSGDWRVSN